MKVRTIIQVIVVFFLASCSLSKTNPLSSNVTPLQATPEPLSSRERIKTIANYIVYYGSGRMNKLARFELAIIQPETLTSSELVALRSAGTLVVAYLSLGEAEPGRPWYTDGRVDLSCVLGKNENWGSYFVDAANPNWQNLMVALTGEFIQKGFDGVFLDTVDTVEVYPNTRQGMIDLIHILRAYYPTALLIQNRGFSVIDDVASDIDALMFEDLSTTYNFSAQQYIVSSDPQTAERMVELHEKTGLPILSLDYAPTDNPGMAYRATQIARQYGFIPAVSVINLDDIPDYGTDKAGPADIRIQSIRADVVAEKLVFTVRVDNIGKQDASGIKLVLTADNVKLAETLTDIRYGEGYIWEVVWLTPLENAQIEAISEFIDSNSENNRFTWNLTATDLAREPLLPLDQQRRRSPDNGFDLIATYLANPITIDGNLSEWNGLPCADVNTREQISYGEISSWLGTTDLSGSICYGWDEDNIYTAFAVKDDIIVQKFTGVNLWMGDHIELWFDTQLQLDFADTTNSQDDYQIGVSPGNFQDVPSNLYIFAPEGILVENYSSLVEYAVIRTRDGYTGEMRIPARVLKGLRLAKDHSIGATFEPSDTDTPGGSIQELMMSTAPFSSANWGNPNYWNNLIFIK